MDIEHSREEGGGIEESNRRGSVSSFCIEKSPTFEDWLATPLFRVAHFREVVSQGHVHGVRV